LAHFCKADNGIISGGRDDPVRRNIRRTASISIRNRRMNWFTLLLAGVFEVVWAVALKHSHGFTRIVPSAVTVIGMAMSVWLLAVSMKTIPLGTAYAIWTGVGAVGGILAGWLVFGETLTGMRILFVMFIVVGIAGLKFCTR
jgi:quaternary ammonium compound-resistance protein SugE